MTAGLSDRRPVRIRRVGKHTSPSQVEKVALQAGKAAPAVAIAGALVAAPQAQNLLAAAPAAAAAPATVTGHQTADGTGAGTVKATLDSFQAQAVTVVSAKPARHAAAAATTTYRVRSGDTLSTIADRFYHNAADWQWIYHENESKLPNPNMIYVGESLTIPGHAVAGPTPTAYVPKHSKTTSKPKKAGGSAEGGGVVVQTTAAGDYTCSGLERIWEEAGGSSAHAFMAAEIAKAESGGNPNAISPTDDFGLWQINGSNGALATLNVLGNARSAIILSDNGSNWNAWTTYHSGAYSGRC
ncbi:MAG TPA: LysM peptidoglycan-binding domain-containing protein [Trebonia sp.]